MVHHELERLSGVPGVHQIKGTPCEHDPHGGESAMERKEREMEGPMMKPARY